MDIITGEILKLNNWEDGKSIERRGSNDSNRTRGGEDDEINIHSKVFVCDDCAVSSIHRNIQNH